MPKSCSRAVDSPTLIQVCVPFFRMYQPLLYANGMTVETCIASSSFLSISSSRVSLQQHAPRVMLDGNRRDQKLRTPARVSQSDQHAPHPSFQGWSAEEIPLPLLRRTVSKRCTRNRSGALLQLVRNVFINILVGNAGFRMELLHFRTSLSCLAQKCNYFQGHLKRKGRGTRTQVIREILEPRISILLPFPIADTPPNMPPKTDPDLMFRIGAWPGNRRGRAACG